MKKFSTQDRITQLLVLETNLLNYRMKEFAVFVQAQDEGKVYQDLSFALGKGLFSKSDHIHGYLDKYHPEIKSVKLKEQAATILNLMSRSSENVCHAVSMLKFNYEAERYNDPDLSIEQKKEIEKKYEENKKIYIHVEKKIDRLHEVLLHPALASEDEKLILSVMDNRIQTIIEDVYLKMEGKEGNGAKFIPLTEVLEVTKE